MISDRARRVLPGLAAVLCGALAALAHPPFGFLPGLLAYGGLMVSAETSLNLRQAFFRGWLAGLVYFTIGCWWISEAFLVDAATFGWLAPIAVAAMAGGLGLFWGAGLVLFRLARISGPARVLVFAAAFCALEYARGHVLTGFPWNLPGTSWRAGGAVSQAAALVGAYGLSFVTVAVSAAPALLWRGWRARRNQVAVGVAAAVLAAMAAYGWTVLAKPSPVTDVALRVVQPNLPQLAHYSVQDRDAIVRDYLALTSLPRAEPGPKLIVWPEGAIPETADSYLAPGGPIRAAITRALRPGDTLLIGAYRVENGLGALRYFNTLIAVRRRAADIELLDVYDKHRLVPFGEYLPFKPLLHAIGFQQLVPVDDGFSSGPRPSPLKVGALILQPLICYEALFPGLAEPKGLRAQALVNVSTDAWFGQTSGPLQHLNQASYRAIEQGAPLVRATPTGVSGVFDARGRTVEMLGLGRKGVIDGRLPAALPASPYARWGDLPFLAMLLVSSLVFVFRKVQRPKKRDSNG